MTNALKQYTNKNGWKTIRVNGREHYNLENIESITPATYNGQTLSSDWHIRRAGMDYSVNVYGGRNGGGGRCDWFIRSPNGSVAVHTSLIACLREINNA